MLSCTSFNILTRGKNQRVPQNLDNPKTGWTLEQGSALGNFSCMCHHWIIVNHSVRIWIIHLLSIIMTITCLMGKFKNIFLQYIYIHHLLIKILWMQYQCQWEILRMWYQCQCGINVVCGIYQCGSTVVCGILLSMWYQCQWSISQCGIIFHQCGVLLLLIVRLCSHSFSNTITWQWCITTTTIARRSCHTHENHVQAKHMIIFYIYIFFFAVCNCYCL